MEITKKETMAGRSRAVLVSHYRVRGNGDGHPGGLEAEGERLRVEENNMINQKQNAGSYKIEFDGSNFSSCIYFYRLEIEGNVFDTKRIVLLK